MIELQSSSTRDLIHYADDYIGSAFASYPETELRKQKINPSNFPITVLISNSSESIINQNKPESIANTQSCQSSSPTSQTVQISLEKDLLENLNQNAQLQERDSQEELNQLTVHNLVDSQGNSLKCRILHSRKDQKNTQSCHSFSPTSQTVQILEKDLLENLNQNAQLQERCSQEELNQLTVHNLVDSQGDSLKCRILHSRKDQKKAYKKEHYQLQMADCRSKSQEVSFGTHSTNSNQTLLQAGGIMSSIAGHDANSDLTNIYATNGSYCAEDIRLLKSDHEVTNKQTESIEFENFNNFYITGEIKSVDSATHNSSTIKNKLQCEERDHISPLDFDSESIWEIENSDIIITEDAVDISHLNNDNCSLIDVLSFPQNNPTAFETTNTFCTSQNLIDTYPLMPNIDHDKEYGLCIKQSQLETIFPTPLISVDPIIERKRKRSHDLKNKRRRLHLNTTTKLDTWPTSPLTTPDVVNLIADWGKTQNTQALSNFYDSTTTEDIVKDLLGVSNPSLTEDATSLAENNINSIETGYTINNNNSSDSFASSLNESVASSLKIFSDNTLSTADSVLSCSSTSTIDGGHHNHQNVSSFNVGMQHAENSCTFRESGISTEERANLLGSIKKRGRPRKEHSDMPDPARMGQLSDIERKRVEDRAKNNEASRLSRLKNKLKEEAEINETKLLIKRNAAMKLELENLNQVLIKLKRALQNRHFKKS